MVNLPAGHALSTQFVPSKTFPAMQLVQVEAPEQALQGELQAVQTEVEPELEPVLSS